MLFNRAAFRKIKKSSKVFNDKKVTDHHAIIPTGIQSNLQYNQQQVYDDYYKAVYCCFYDDCSVANTTVIGKAADVAFKTTGKVILQRMAHCF
jgi:DNA topoisomerase-3